MRRHFLIVAFVFVSLGLAFSNAFVRVAVADELYPVMCGDYIKDGRNRGVHEIVGYMTENGKAYHLIKAENAPESMAFKTPIDSSGNMPFLKNVGPCRSGKTRLGPDQPKPGAVAQVAVQPTAVAPQAAAAQVKPTEPAPVTLQGLQKEASDGVSEGILKSIGVLALLAGASLVGLAIFMRWQHYKAQQTSA